MARDPVSACFFDDRSEFVRARIPMKGYYSGCSGGPTPSRHAGKTVETDRVNPDEEDRSMKNRLMYAFAIVALVFALAFPVVAPAAPPAPKPQPAPAATPAPE